MFGILSSDIKRYIFLTSETKNLFPKYIDYFVMEGLINEKDFDSIEVLDNESMNIVYTGSLNFFLRNKRFGELIY